MPVKKHVSSLKLVFSPLSTHPPASTNRREAPLLDALDEAFYSLRDAGSAREAGRLRQQFDALQQQVGGSEGRAVWVGWCSAFGGLRREDGMAAVHW